MRGGAGGGGGGGRGKGSAAFGFLLEMWDGRRSAGGNRNAGAFRYPDRGEVRWHTRGRSRGHKAAPVLIKRHTAPDCLL